MTKPRRNLRSRFLAPAAGVVLALLASTCFGGCFVSFDGYELAAGGGAANGAGASGASSGGVAISGGGQVTLAGSGNIAGTMNAGAGGVLGGGGTIVVAGGAGAGGSNAGAGGAAATAGSAAGGSAGIAGGAGSAGGPQSCPVDSLGRFSDEIPLPTGGIYCIDRLEVRNKDYAVFLASNPMAIPSNQVAVCAFNNSFQPDMTGGCDQYDPTNKANSPVACVDWCDAEKFCESVGKHLCGKIGGGANAPADFADPAKSEWFRACSHAGDNDFPYGNLYQSDACGGLDNLAAINPLPVPNSNCLGGYDALWDMSGNVAEWENSCTGSAGAADLCLYRGGSFLDTNKTVGAAPSLLCNSNTHGAPKSAAKARSTRDKEIGFRCCLEL